MNKIRIIFAFSILLLSISNVSIAANSFVNYVYDAKFVYQGKYDTNSLYYHNPRNPNWQKGFSKTLADVICKEAYNSFVRTGVWWGHLESDGSCGSKEEPVEWATGNKLNFDN